MLAGMNDLKDMVPDAATSDYVGGGGAEIFLAVGNEMLDRFKSMAGLQPHEKVLDVGCGIGRIAIPLTQYLDGGSYDGFDIVKHGIDWCRAKITPRYPAFRFFHADVHNKLYNPGGTIAAAEYVFPFPDATFDFVFLTSVFTHMMPVDLEHYLAEIGRVLKPAGRCFATAFVISPEGAAHLQRGDSVKKFQAQEGGYWTDHPGIPEAAIAYPDEYLERVFARSRLAIESLQQHGWWTSPFAQDILVARKAA